MIHKNYLKIIQDNTRKLPQRVWVVLKNKVVIPNIDFQACLCLIHCISIYFCTCFDKSLHLFFIFLPKYEQYCIQFSGAHTDIFSICFLGIFRHTVTSQVDNKTHLTVSFDISSNDNTDGDSSVFYCCCQCCRESIGIFSLSMQPVFIITVIAPLLSLQNVIEHSMEIGTDMKVEDLIFLVHSYIVISSVFIVQCTMLIVVDRLRGKTQSDMMWGNTFVF